jgi:hypothetical protein
MSYDLSAKELKNTIASEPNTRLEHFVRKVQQTGEIWTLADGEALLVLGSEESQQFIAVWPHPDYALGWFEDSGVEEADLVAMNLSDWIEGTLDELAEAQIDIDVFPTSEQDGKIVSAGDLLKRLGSETP